MNLLHMKYAVEVAETGSINKAAEKLLIGQPNLSRAIKELETSLDIKIFERTSKGMYLTSDGEIFINHAKSILKKVDNLEEVFKKGASSEKHFSISVPRASYIAEAFAAFSNCLSEFERVEVYYKETNALRVIKNILQENYKLGIIRYADKYDHYYKSMVDDKGLAYTMITEFKHVLIMRADSPLATKESITSEDLKNYIEIAHADPYVPSLSPIEVKREEFPDNTERHIFVFERASQFELLSQNPETYMWVSPVPADILKRYGLMQKNCAGERRTYKDVLLYRKGHRLSELEQLFIDRLVESKRRTFDNKII